MYSVSQMCEGATRVWQSQRLINYTSHLQEEEKNHDIDLKITRPLYQNTLGACLIGVFVSEPLGSLFQSGLQAALCICDGLDIGLV